MGNLSLCDRFFCIKNIFIAMCKLDMKQRMYFCAIVQRNIKLTLKGGICIENKIEVEYKCED